MRIYIAGPMRGYTLDNFPAFDEAAEYLKRCDWEVISPAELDRLGGQQGIGGTPSINGNWRFTEWDATSKYWKYAFAGTIGNFVVRADPFNLRFNFLGATGRNSGR